LSFGGRHLGRRERNSLSFQIPFPIIALVLAKQGVAETVVVVTNSSTQGGWTKKNRKPYQKNNATIHDGEQKRLIGKKERKKINNNVHEAQLFPGHMVPYKTMTRER
jgi:hypothetical protein